MKWLWQQKAGETKETTEGRTTHPDKWLKWVAGRWWRGERGLWTQTCFLAQGDYGGQSCLPQGEYPIIPNSTQLPFPLSPLCPLWFNRIPSVSVLPILLTCDSHVESHDVYATAPTELPYCSLPGHIYSPTKLEALYEQRSHLLVTVQHMLSQCGLMVCWLVNTTVGRDISLLSFSRVLKIF